MAHHLLLLGLLKLLSPGTFTQPVYFFNTDRVQAICWVKCLSI